MVQTRDQLMFCYRAILDEYIRLWRDGKERKKILDAAAAQANAAGTPTETPTETPAVTSAVTPVTPAVTPAVTTDVLTQAENSTIANTDSEIKNPDSDGKKVDEVVGF